MIDEQVELVRQKIQKLKEGEKSSAKDESASFLFSLVIKVLSIYGSQYYVLKKMHIEPFQPWETFVLIFGVLSLTSLIKVKK
jgi:hypothetical protein